MRFLVPVFIAAIVAVVVLVGIVLNRPRPKLPAADQRLLDQAAGLLARLRNPTNVDEVDLLSEKSKASVDRWLKSYNERHAKW